MEISRGAEATPEDQLEMQAALQRYIDNAISKTVNVPAQFPFERLCALHAAAYRLDLEGCTTFRPNPVTGAVLVPPVRYAALLHHSGGDR